MGLLTIIPGDKAIHTPTQTRVHILSYADGNFTAVGLDEDNNLITTRRIVAPVTEFAATTHTAPKPAADSALSATAQRIADLQAQVATLHKKLQAAEQRADDAASRAAELLAQPAQAITPAATKIEVRVERNISSFEMAMLLNAGWSVMHMQFIPIAAGYEDASDEHLNVVLQRTVPADPQPQPEQRAAVPRTVTGTVVPMSQQIDDDEDDNDDNLSPGTNLWGAPDKKPAPVPVPSPLRSGEGAGGEASAADFTRAVLSARLPPAQTLELLNAQLKEKARAAFNAAPAPLPYMPLGVSK